MRIRHGGGVRNGEIYKEVKETEDRVVRGKMAVEKAAGRATGRSVSNDKRRCVCSRCVDYKETRLVFEGRLYSEKKHDNCSQGRERNDRNKHLSEEEKRKGCHRNQVTQSRENADISRATSGLLGK